MSSQIDQPKQEKETPGTSWVSRVDLSRMQNEVCLLWIISNWCHQILTNEITFAKIVEDDMAMKEDLYQATVILSERMEHLANMCETLMSAHDDNCKKRETVDKACQTESFTLVNSVVTPAKKHEEPLLPDMTNQQPPTHSGSHNNKVNLIQNNTTLLELMILDADLRQSLTTNKIKKILP